MRRNSLSSDISVDNTGPGDAGPAAAARPRIGLALGAGAARGWAHIGVIKRLVAAGIVPDVVAGTSIGALCGGCYVAGKLPQLEEFARGLTRRRVFSLMDFSWRGSGLIAGNRLARLLENELGDTRIESLDTPFICIGTELRTGHEIWLKEGILADAIRASYALPGIFKPVHFNDMWLIDGAVVNPVPVSACRALGARVVIAVNLTTDVFGAGTVIQAPILNHDDNNYEQSLRQPIASETARAAYVRQFFGRPGGSPGITTVLVAAFNITQDRLARSRLAGDPPDITINPRSPEVGLFDFDKADASIRSGWESTERVLADLERSIEVLRQTTPA